MPSCTPFHNFLDRRRIPYEAGVGGLHVYPSWTRQHPFSKDLFLEGSGITELPEGLTVHGSLDLTNTQLPRLPEHLTVVEDLNLTGVSILQLPETLSVGGHILAGDSRLASLPDGLHVHGALVLSNTHILSLPEGLRVDGSLDIRNTRVKVLPSRLQVQGTIFPPKGLHDIQAFMDGQPDLVSLSLVGSQHHRLDLLVGLAAYPDLWSVLMSLEPDTQLSIWRGPDGGYETQFDVLGSESPENPYSQEDSL